MRQSLKQKTISGLIWSFTDLLINQGFALVIQVILARLLMPADFGIIGMVAVFIAVSQSIADCGFTNALIREPDANQVDYSTVFYFNLLMSVLMYVIVFASAEIISEFFRENRLVSILRVLATTLIINSFGAIHRTMLIKKVDFKRQAVINMCATILSGVTAVICALKGYGVWSLVFQRISIQGFQALGLYLTNRWLPSFVFSIHSFKHFFAFGWKLLLSGLINTLYINLDYVIIGRYFSAIILGYYTNAQKLQNVASQALTGAVQKVSYPILSQMQHDGQGMKQGYRKIIKSTVFFNFPVMIGLATIAEPLLTLVLGEKWVPAISYFQILCFAGILFPIHAINLNVLKVNGRSDLFLRIEIIKKVFGLTLIGLVLLLKLGIMGLLWVSVMNSIIAYFINSYYSAELLDYSTWMQLKDIMPIFSAAAIMGLIVTGIGHMLTTGLFVQLMIQILTGVVTFFLLCIVFKIEELRNILNIVKHEFIQSSNK